MSDVDRLVHYIRKTLDLDSAISGAEYRYASLPLCVVDAVFSLGARYESVQRTVRDWCVRYGWQIERIEDTEEHKISDFLHLLEPYANRWEAMANEVFRNRQRTSTRSGILKAEAVYRFANVLHSFRIETFADALELGPLPELRRAITLIPGQGSGLSFNYFLILAGNVNGVKADRMVTRFVADALGLRNVQSEPCERLVREATAALQGDFSYLSPAHLDNAIWNYQRTRAAAGASSQCTRGTGV